MKLALPDPELLKKMDFKSPAVWLATWFGFGFMKPAPGTWGTIGAIPFALILVALGGKLALIAGIAIVFLLGLWSAGKFGAMTQSHDNSMIVIDEVVGIWIALLASSFSPLSILGAIVLFRFFDILKPWPISWFDQKVEGSLGVMLDDVVAGKFAALCLFGIHYYALAG